MMSREGTACTVLLTVFLVSTLIACGGGGDDTGTATVAPEADTVSTEPVVITIGNLTDLTGIASGAFVTVNQALKDMARYYSDHRLIPGVRFEVVEYDTGYEPSKYAAGYESLMSRGADVIFTAIADAGSVLKSRLEEDRMIMFSVMLLKDAVDPPGWVFGPGAGDIGSYAFTLLKWVSENDPNFPQERPARIGGALWNESNAGELLTAAKEYAEAHTDQFEWVFGALPDVKFSWAQEAEAMKDCDYVIPPLLLGRFVEDYAAAGYSTTYLGTDSHLGFLAQIEDAGLWAEVNGALFIQPGIWWTDEGEIVDLTWDLLHEYHPGQEQNLVGEGSGYLASYPIYVMLGLIAHTVDTAGAEGLTTQAVYDAADTFSMIANGSSNSFSATKRTSCDDLAIYELRANEKDVFRVTSDWVPIVTSP